MSSIRPNADTEPGCRPRQRTILSSEANDSFPCRSMCSRLWMSSNLWHSMLTR